MADQNFDSDIEAASKLYNVPSWRLRAMIATESSGNPNAVSPAGAKGLMQFTDATAKDVGLDNPFDPKASIYAGAKYMSHLHQRFGDWDTAHAAYDFGPAAVARGDTYPDETNKYIKKINSFAPQEDSGFQDYPKATNASFGGFEDIKKASDTGDFEDIKKPATGGFEDIKEDSLLDKTRNATSAMIEDAIGSAKAIGNIIPGLASSTMGTMTGIGSMLLDLKNNKPVSTENAQKAKETLEEGLGQPFGAPNPENPISTILGGAASISGDAIDSLAKAYGTFSDMAHGIPTRDQTGADPFIKSNLQDIVSLGTMRGGQKAMKPSEAPLDPSLYPRLTGPDTPPPAPTPNALDTVAASRDAANQKLMDMYNEHPFAYGVDTSGQVNPFTNGVGKEINPQIEDPGMPAGMLQDVVDHGAFNPYFRGGEALNHPEMSFDPADGYLKLNDSFKLQEAAIPEGQESPNVNLDQRKTPTNVELVAMREKGNQVISQIENEGLSIQQVKDQFYNTTYKELPQEVKDKFDTLEQMANRGSNMVPAAKPSDLQGMQRWQLALMHEANNVAWGPQAKAALENKIDSFQLPDDPSQSFGLKMMMAGVGNDEATTNERLLATADPNKQTAYIHNLIDTVQQGGSNGGSLNKILQNVAQLSDDPFERTLARALISPLNDAQVFIKHDPDATAYGRTMLGFNGNPNKIVLYINADNRNITGLSSITLLHEASHSRLAPIIEIGRDAALRAKYPEIARFADELGNFWTAVVQSMPDINKAMHYAKFGAIEGKGSYGHELISWGLTQPSIIRALKLATMSPDGKTLTYNAPEGSGKSAFSHLSSLLSRAIGLGNLPNQNKIQSQMGDFLESNNSAFKELADLVLPILEFSKDLKFSSEDLLTAFGTGGWWKMGTFDPEMKKTDLPKKAIQVSPYTSIEDFNQDFKEPEDFRKFPDTEGVLGAGLVANALPTTMAKNLLGNPIFTFSVMRDREINGASHALYLALMNAIKPFREAPKEQKNRITTAMSQWNTPEQQDILKMTRAHNSGEQWRKDPKNLAILPQEALQFGMKPEDYKLYSTTLEPLFYTLWKIDKAKLATFGRAPQSDVVGYFPRSFGFGSFIVKGLAKDPMTGVDTLVAYRRVTTFVEQGQFVKAFKGMGLKVVKEQGKDFSEWIDHLLALIEIDPNTKMAKEAEDVIRRMEEHMRTQEFERSARNVTGYLGSQLNNPRELDMLENLIYQRIKMTVDTYKATRIMKEIARPIRMNPLMRREWPHAVKTIGDLLRRDLGGDISEFKALDNTIQSLLNTGYKAYLHVKPSTRALLKDLNPSVATSRRKGVKRPKTYQHELVLSKDAQRVLSRELAAVGSAWALVGNVPNMLTNATTIFFVSILGGAIDNFILSDNIEEKAKGLYYAFHAHALAVSDYAMYISQDYRLDKQVRDFMYEISARGWLQPAQFSDVKELRSNMEKSPLAQKAARTLEKPKEWFNDPIETATNIMTFLYYNRLFKMLKPDMSANSHMKMVLEFSKNYTGDYGSWNKPLIFDKMGFAGHLANNFVIWAGTRAAQAMFLAKNPGLGGWEAMAALMASMIATAGVEGLPFMDDYENVRQGLHRISSGNINLPPVDKVLKDNGMPYVARLGLINKSLGLDVATRMKWSGPTSMSTVTYSLPAKAYDIFTYIYKDLTNAAGIQAPSVEETSNFTNALPQMLKGPAQQLLLSDPVGKDAQGKTITNIHSKYGKTMFTQRNNYDRTINIIGFKNTEQAEDQRNAYNEHYEESVETQQEKQLRQAALDNAVEAQEWAMKGNTMMQAHYTKLAAKALNQYAVQHEGIYRSFPAMVEQAIKDRRLDVSTRMAAEEAKKKKSPRQVQIIKGIIDEARSYGPK